MHVRLDGPVPTNRRNQIPDLRSRQSCPDANEQPRSQTRRMGLPVWTAEKRPGVVDWGVNGAAYMAHMECLGNCSVLLGKQLVSDARSSQLPGQGRLKNPSSTIPSKVLEGHLTSLCGVASCSTVLARCAKDIYVTLKLGSVHRLISQKAGLRPLDEDL